MRARGPALLIALELVPAALWLTAQPLEARFATLSSALGSLGVLLGLIGFSAFALNLLLAGRLTIVDRFFGGLDKMFRVHQINGRAAYLLLLAHAVLIFAGRATLSPAAALQLFSPAGNITVFLGVLALVGMTVGICLTLYVRLNHEIFVYVQRAFGFLFILGALHAFRTPGIKAASAPLTFYLTALAVAGIAAFVYRSLFDNVLVRRFDYRVADVRALDEDVTEIVMTPVDKHLKYRPGQFLFVTFFSDAMRKNLHPFSVNVEGESAVLSFRPGEIHDQFHPFSISSTPRDSQLKVVFKDVGDYTHAMRSLEKGAWARVEGAYGGFSHTKLRGRRQIWIAGGIGITPFLSMARSLSETPGYEIDFYYAMKSIRRAYLLAEFLRIGETVPGFRVIPYPEDEVGFLTGDAIAERSGDLREFELMICGPPGMIDALRAQLYERGVPKRNVHFEKFGFTPKRAAR